MVGPPQGCDAEYTASSGDQFWADRCGTFTDPHGYQWTIATHKEDLTPEEIKQRQDAWMKQFAPQPSHS